MVFRGGAGSDPLPGSTEELEALSRRATDQERLLGFLAAPVAAAIGLLVLGNVPPSVTDAGHRSLYYELAGVLLGLSVITLIASLLRRRLLVGLALALYGLDLFNLRYWGFGIPFILAGSWLLVRAFRIQRALREASAPGPAPRPPGRGANKRYTPPRRGGGRRRN